MSSEQFQIPREFIESIAELTAQVDDHNRNAIILLTGSVAAGTATSDSDVDFFVLRVSDDDQTMASEHSFVLRTGREGNIVYGNSAHITDLLERFRRALTAVTHPHDPSGQLQRFTEADRRQLHRLATGIPLQGEETISSLREKYRLNSLNIYLCYYYLVGYYSYIKKAHVKSKELGPVVGASMLNVAAYRLAGAILASVGETSPEPEWRPYLIQHNSRLSSEDVSGALQHCLNISLNGFLSQLDEFQAFAAGAIERIAQRGTAMAELQTYFMSKQQRNRLGIRVRSQG